MQWWAPCSDGCFAILPPLPQLVTFSHYDRLSTFHQCMKGKKWLHYDRLSTFHQCIKGGKWLHYHIMTDRLLSTSTWKGAGTGLWCRFLRLFCLWLLCVEWPPPSSLTESISGLLTTRLISFFRLMDPPCFLLHPDIFLLLKPLSDICWCWL